MTATDQLRSVIRDLEAKARQLELDKKLTTFADSADHLLREAASRAGEYAADNRVRVEGALDRAGAAVDSRTDGKYHRTFDKLRTGVLTGVDWVVEQRGESTTTSASAGAAATSATSAGASGGSPETAPPPGSAETPWVDVTDDPGTGASGTTPGGPAASS